MLTKYKLEAILDLNLRSRIPKYLVLNEIHTTFVNAFLSTYLLNEIHTTLVNVRGTLLFFKFCNDPGKITYCKQMDVATITILYLYFDRLFVTWILP